VIRSAAAEDRGAIAALVGAHGAGWSRLSVFATLDAPSTRTWVALDGRRIVGSVLASVAADQGEVLDLVVLPDERRKGHARALLGTVADAWRTEGVRRALLEVRSDNEAAQALYLSMGWRPAGRRTRYYADRTDAVLLAWEDP
jgi:ribosomal-protein-alanine N-acetyltransferase